MSNYNLQHVDNYKKKLEDTSKQVFLKYVKIITEYVNLFSENVKIKDKSYNIYIFRKGLESLTHIFNILLLYTNNLEITVYHCQTSYFYYIEFISQIENTSNNFLQLNGKDASLFIYKKTIFDINSEIKTNFNLNTHNEIKIINIKLLTQIYCELILNLFNCYIDNPKNMIIDLNKYINKIANLYDKNEYIFYEHINIINAFFEKFIFNNPIDNQYKIYGNIEVFINKLKKYGTRNLHNDIMSNINNYDSYNKLDTCTYIKFINYILKL